MGFEDTNLLNRIGEVNYNKFGSKMKIIEYNNSSDIIVEFENGYLKHCAYFDFKRGYVKSPYEKRTCGVGYIGEGKYYPTNENNKQTIVHKYWSGMFTRCYDEKFLNRRPTYKDCMVDEKWHNFQNFAEWFYANYYTIDYEIMCLDKDILHKGNKIYAPENCVFVPKSINSLFVKCDAVRGKFPIGIRFKEKNK